MKSFLEMMLGGLLVLTLTGCRIYAFYSGYKSLTPEEKAYVIDYAHVDNIEEASNGKIYQILSENLKSAMNKYEYNVIYRWATRCPSENCIPPSLAELEAQEKGYKLWVISDYYDKEIIGIDLGMPIYSIKNSVYHTDFCQKYTSLFLKDLGWIERKDKWGRFYLFKGSEFLAQENRIADFLAVFLSFKFPPAGGHSVTWTQTTSLIPEYPEFTPCIYKIINSFIKIAKL